MTILSDNRNFVTEEPICQQDRESHDQCTGSRRYPLKQDHHPLRCFGQQGVKNFRQEFHVVHCMLYCNNLCANTIVKDCIRHVYNWFLCPINVNTIYIVQLFTVWILWCWVVIRVNGNSANAWQYYCSILHTAGIKLTMHVSLFMYYQE